MYGLNLIDWYFYWNRLVMNKKHENIDYNFYCTIKKNHYTHCNFFLVLVVLKYYPNSSWSLKCETRGRAWFDINQSKTSLLIVYIGTYIPVDTKATHINVKCSATVSKSNDDYQETDVGLFSCCLQYFIQLERSEIWLKSEKTGWTLL